MRLVLWPTVAGFALLTLLVSAFNAGVLLRDAAYSRIPLENVLTMIGLRDLIAAEVLLPTSLYVGALTTLNQWHRNREAFALYGAGALPTRVARPVWELAVLVCIGVAALSLYARPWAFAEGYRLDAAATRLSAAAMQPDRFYNFGTDVVLSAQFIDRDTQLMRGVFVQRREANQINVIRAETGTIHSAQADARQFVDLGRGVSYSISEAGVADRVTRFAQLVYYADAPATADVENKRRAMPTASLMLMDAPKERAELQWRFCLPIIALLMTLIAVELARAKPGSGPYARFVAGIAIYMIVFNLAAVARTWLENDLVGAFPGMWWVPALTGAFYVVLRQLPTLSMKRPG